MAAFFQTRRAYALTALALAALLLAPFFLVDTPPILDYPNHLARLYVLAFGADDPLLSRMYEPAWSVLPNLAVDLIGPGLMQIFGVELAGKMLLAGALLLPPAGAAAYNRVAFGRFSYWSLATAIVAFNGIFFLGFMNFLFGVGVAFFGAAFWMFMRPRNLIGAALGAAAFALACYFCHIIAALLLGLLIASHELGEAWTRRKEGALHWRALMPSAIAVALAFVPLLVLYKIGMAETAGTPWVWTSLQSKIAGLLSPFTIYDRVLGPLSGAAVFLFLRLYPKRWRFHPGAIVALLVLLPAYFAAPHMMHGGSFVDVRLPLMMALLLFAGAQPEFPPRAAWLLAAAVAAVLLVRSANVGLTWYAHRAELADFRRVTRDIKPGDKVLTAVVAGDHTLAYFDREPASRHVPNLYRTDMHLAALLLIEKHAFWPALFADPHQQPLRVRPPYDEIALPLGEPIDTRFLSTDEIPPVMFEYAPYLQHRWTRFDYVLVMRAGAMPDPRAFRPDKLELIEASDIAALYRIRH